MTRLALLSLLASSLPLLAQNDAAAGNDASDTSKPVASWDFKDSKEPGPRAPTYPSFAVTNTAALSDGKAPVLTVPGSEPELHFGLNDSITLEAWVKVKSIGEGNLVYVLGKGRAKGNTKNQNYALRLKGTKGEASISFLFASAATEGKPAAEGKPASKAVSASWHRWTSTDTFGLTGWHHIAVTYTFGKGKSIAGYIDGVPTKGTWDMDGVTDRAPVSDDDDLVLGTGNGGGKSNSFVGWMDDVHIWRSALPAEVLKTRYQFVPPPPIVKRKDVPKGQVLVHLCEGGMPKTNAWPDEPSKATETYKDKAFGFFEEPQKYVDTGVRGDRAIPHLFRAAALVTLPAGKQRLLLRGRSGCRLYIDGKPILSTPINTRDGSGHGHVSEQKDYLDLGPDFRFAPPGNREATCEYTSAGKEVLVVMEALVGGYSGKNKRRPELGETVVAWSKQGTETWQLLTPDGSVIPYTDAGWAEYEKTKRIELASINAAARAKLRSAQEAYWAKRRDTAKAWLAKTPEVAIPKTEYESPIDAFLGARLAQVMADNSAAKTGTVDYFKDVQPLLETKCYDCHQGSKTKGELRLDERAGALKGGESDGPAITPGKHTASSLIARITSTDEDDVMPPKGKPLTKAEVATLTTWINEGAHWPEMRADHTKITPLTTDLAFLRRVYLDTVGVPPMLAEIAAFQAKPDRAAVIDILLKDPRWADNWMGYWEDVLAENPNILNPTLNNTGPFRWWIYESLLDNKPMDLFVTELLRMRGSERFGGPAGFAVASSNDVPMAAKGTIVSTAFLGIEMKCARCHDAPAHKWKQEQLFQLAAMLGTKTIEVPKTSSVPMDRFHGMSRKPLIQVTLQPGSKVAPQWPFDEFCDASNATLAQDKDDPRDRLAALITAPQNQRFAQVMANRVWKRFMGRGIVEPVDDWEKGKPTHPELMQWLGREFVRGGYDVKHLARLILNTQAYQRATDAELRAPSPLYTSPAPRRLAAEQIVDSLFAATGKPMRTEEASLDIDGSRDMGNSLSLGQPTRSWMLTSTSNERDRPSLSLPRLQAVGDVLTAFGWRGARQDPTSKRDELPNSLQPAILGNGMMGTWLTVLSDDHGITALAEKDQALDAFIDSLFLKLLTRHPTPEESKLYTEHLGEGYATRIASPSSVKASPSTRSRPLYVSWSNHLDAEATTVRMAQEAAARIGDPPTQRLSEAWRVKLEDVLWSLLNAPEWVFAP